MATPVTIKSILNNLDIKCHNIQGPATPELPRGENWYDKCATSAVKVEDSNK
jgi:hypothetical protein